MSRTIFVTALALVLAATFAFAQQAGQQYGQQQPSQQQPGQQQPGQQQPGQQQPGAMAMQQRMATGAQRVATIAEQQNIDLHKAVQAAEQQAKGKAIAAVLLQPQGQAGTGQPGAAGTTGQQQLTAHVVVATENQLQFVAVDPKANKVLTMQNRPFIQNLWQPQGGTGGSSGAMQDQGQSGSSMGQGGSAGMQDQSQSDQSSMRGQTGGAGGTTGQQGMLTQDVAQRIYRQVEQQNVDLRRAIQTAEKDAQGKAVAAFFVPPGQAGAMGQGGTGGARDSGISGQTGAGGSAGQQTPIAHVYTVTGNQIKLATVDAKSNKVLNVETRQMINAPWEGGRMGTGGTTGMGQGSSGQSDQSTGGESSPSFPTGSGSGGGPGTLGGD